MRDFLIEYVKTTEFKQDFSTQKKTAFKEILGKEGLIMKFSIATKNKQAIIIIIDATLYVV